VLVPATWVETRDVPLTELTKYPGNARRGDVGQIRASLRKHGQYRSLIARDTGAGLVILTGNHTFEALTAEGHQAARCEIITCADDEAATINLADNRISDLGTYDDSLLAELLAGVTELNGTGYVDDDLDRLLRDTDLIGNQATSFLSDIIGDGPAPHANQPLAPEMPHTSSGLPEYVQMTWLVTIEDRTDIRHALAAVQERHGLHTSAEALAVLAREALNEKAAP
jgi:hypothetical protein